MTVASRSTSSSAGRTGFLIVLALVGAGAVACGGSSAPRQVPAAIPSTGGVTSAPIAANTAGPSVTETLNNGYQFQVAMAAPGISTKTTFTTDDGTGTGGHAIDAPPGTTLIVATLTFTNKSGRPEPFAPAPTGPLPDYSNDGSGILAVPQSDATAFGLPTAQQSASCGTSTEPIPAPAGYCDLRASIAAYSPASTDFTQQPQLAAGATGTLTLVAGGTSGLGTPVPEGAPMRDVKVFIERCVQSSGCWAQLS